MISINRLEEMAIEELQTELKNFKEQIKLQNNFIESLLKATNNSEWLNKTILDDEAAEIIEKIELDYAQLDQLKGVIKKYEECNKYLVEENGKIYTRLEYKLLKTLAEIREIVKEQIPTANYNFAKSMNPEKFECYEQILQKIKECEVDE